MIPQSEVADLTRQYADAVHELKLAVNERAALVTYYKSQNLSQCGSTFAANAARMRVARLLVSDLRQLLATLTAPEQTDGAA